MGSGDWAMFVGICPVDFGNDGGSQGLDAPKDLSCLSGTNSVAPTASNRGQLEHSH